MAKKEKKKTPADLDLESRLFLLETRVEEGERRHLKLKKDFAEALSLVLAGSGWISDVHRQKLVEVAFKYRGLNN